MSLAWIIGLPGRVSYWLLGGKRLTEPAGNLVDRRHSFAGRSLRFDSREGRAYRRAVRWISLLACCLIAPPLAAGDWPAYGNDPGGSQYSDLRQIDRDNVRRLRQAWEHHSGDRIDAPGLGGTSYEVTPIHANGRLYYCTPLHKVIALDPATGEEQWRFDARAAAADPEMPPGPCRGVAYWESENEGACARRVFAGDMRGRLWALDADDGQPCTDFGAAGGHPGYVHSDADFDNHGEGWWAITSPPAVYRDLVITGSALDDTVANAKDGILRAFDTRSGELRWAFNPVPAKLSAQTGGGNAWAPLSVDVEHGLLFVPFTSLSTDHFGGLRGAGSPYADAVTALDLADGQVRWQRQLVHHDLFDYDLPSQPLLVSILKDGRRREVAIQVVKTGEIFVFDRANGEPLFPIEERPAPASTVPGEQAAETQPRSTGIQPVLPQALQRDELFGLTLLDREWCRRRFDELRYDGPFTPPDTRGSLIYPSTRGGPNWGSAAYHPGENLLIVRADRLASIVTLFQPDDPAAQPVSTDYSDRLLPLRGTPWWVRVRPFLSPLGVPCTPPPWGTLTAIDMASGKQRWQRELGQARGFGLTLPAATGWGSPSLGGPLVTAGGLVFIAAGMDGHFRALDIVDGRELWHKPLPAPGMAVPMTYMAGGRQFVVIAAGGNASLGTPLGDAIVAFALPAD
ncbi:MAG: pyrroloquinoline quinone-dependent dehydrogenase [Gammaproteobacteria bacterium]|nr:MAG: pyrroloquinoline quinone-dependent dehydrogenase [Gammaproteobacteria bacterium]